MTLLVALVLLASPEPAPETAPETALETALETERMLLGPSPFFRVEGMERAVREKRVDLLLRATASRAWDARRVAAIGLGNLGLGQKVPVALLRDPVAVVRAAAVRSLDTHAPVPTLVALLNDSDDSIRAAAAWALRDADQSSALRPLLRDPSLSVRLAAMAASGRQRELLKMARGKDLAEAIGALSWLGRCGNASSAGVLLRQLALSLKAPKTTRKSRRKLGGAPPLVTSDRALARAVGEIARRGVSVGGVSVAERVRRLVTETKLEGRTSAILTEAVAASRDAEAAHRIIDAQINARKTSPIPFAELNLGFRGSMHAFARDPWLALAPLLLPVLEDKDPIVRRAVSEALYGDAARVALRDSDAIVRAFACARVGRVKPLLRMLGDQDPRVRTAAIRALVRLGAESAPILALQGDPDADVRRAVIGAAIRLPVAGRSEFLYDRAMEDDDEQVRASAAASFDFLGDRSVFPKAIADLSASDYAARERAKELLHRLAPARFGYDPGKPTVGAAAWEAWWKTRKKQKPGAFVYHVEDLRRKGLDLVLLIDATGSMEPLILATMRTLRVVMRELRTVVPDLRVRVVFYRDRHEEFLTLSSPLTHDTRILGDFLTAVPAVGGGDIKEAVLDGMRSATVKTKWRGKPQRVVLLFGDSPPHDRDLTLLESTVREFKGVVHTVDVTGYGRARRGGGLSSFAKIAEWGGGAFVRSGNDQQLLREILVLTLGPKHRAEIETLFGLR